VESITSISRTEKSADQKTSVQHSAKQFAASWLLSRLIFDPENGSGKFLRNADSHTDYTELYPRR
jgi:hypothetical protein